MTLGWSCTYFYHLLRHKASTKHAYTRTNIPIETSMQSKNHKSHQSHVSQSAAEKFSNTVAYYIASTPSYEHRPYFERKAQHIFLFRYVKVFSAILWDWVIFSKKSFFADQLNVQLTLFYVDVAYICRQNMSEHARTYLNMSEHVRTCLHAVWWWGTNKCSWKVSLKWCSGGKWCLDMFRQVWRCRNSCMTSLAVWGFSTYFSRLRSPAASLTYDICEFLIIYFAFIQDLRWWRCICRGCCYCGEMHFLVRPKNWNRRRLEATHSRGRSPSKVVQGHLEVSIGYTLCSVESICIFFFVGYFSHPCNCVVRESFLISLAYQLRRRFLREVHRKGAHPLWPLSWRGLIPIKLAYNKSVCHQSW